MVGWSRRNREGRERRDAEAERWASLTDAQRARERADHDTASIRLFVVVALGIGGVVAGAIFDATRPNAPRAAPAPTTSTSHPWLPTH